MARAGAGAAAKFSWIGSRPRAENKHPWVRPDISKRLVSTPGDEGIYSQENPRRSDRCSVLREGGGSPPRVPVCTATPFRGTVGGQPCGGETPQTPLCRVTKVSGRGEGRGEGRADGCPGRAVMRRALSSAVLTEGRPGKCLTDPSQLSRSLKTRKSEEPSQPREDPRGHDDLVSRGILGEVPEQERTPSKNGGDLDKL